MYFPQLRRMMLNDLCALFQFKMKAKVAPSVVEGVQTQEQHFHALKAVWDRELMRKQ
jgi:hypothetical protein